eukprot:151962_1
MTSLSALHVSDIMANQPVVVDNGTGVLKAGFAGADKPKVVFLSCVGRPKHTRAMAGGALEKGGKGGVFVGAKMSEHRGALKLSYPMQHGVVQNWVTWSLCGHTCTTENNSTW